MCIETCAGSRAANGALGKLSQIIALFHASLISHRTTNQPRSSFTDNQKAWCVNSPGNPVAAPRGGSMRRDIGEADVLQYSYSSFIHPSSHVRHEQALIFFAHVWISLINIVPAGKIGLAKRIMKLWNILWLSTWWYQLLWQ